MKILHINSYDKGGGAETVFNISRSLEHTGFINYYGFANNKKDKNQNINFSSWENNNKLLGAINYIFSVRNYKVLYNFLSYNHIDIIHIHGFFASLSPSILLAIHKHKKTNKIKIIQTCHDYHVICPNSSLYNFNKNIICEKCIGKKYKWFIFKDNCDRRGRVYSIIKGIRSFISNNVLNHKNLIDQFIVPSNFLKQKLLEDGIKEDKITLIRNPITENNYINQNKKENIFCYFGRFTTEKNLQFLINAFIEWKKQTQNDFKLLLIGEGEEEADLKNIAKNSDFANDIIFKTFLPKEELLDEIKNVKYFSLTSKCYENFPMSILESFELNILPIAPNIGGMEESINDFLEVGVTYQEGNVDSWINSVSLLEKNYKEYLNKLIAKKEDVLSKLEIGNYYLNILKVYKNIISD